MTPDPVATAADLFEQVQRVFAGRFELRQLIAVSETRTLFVAKDPILNRLVALGIHDQPGTRRRTWFERETELLAELDHPSIRAVYAAGYEGDWAYRVSKWIDGESLLQASARGPRTIPTVLQLARDLVDVLDYAHRRQIVLRRIVPSSVMIDVEGRAVINDVRFANRCLEWADLDPDPWAEAFLAPETWHGHAGEPASDIYALGAVLYFAVTGERPASDPARVRPPCELRETCPQTLQRVILTAMQPDPRDRYMNAADLAADLLSELGEFDSVTGAPITHAPRDRDAWEQRLRRALGAEYELLSELGRGGFGNVYRVRDLRLEREVALKILHPTLTADPGVVERFQREAQLAAKLRHRNIVEIYDISGRAGLLWYTMAYVRGMNLADLVLERGQLPTEQVITIIAAVLDALAHAHAHGIVHRDIKPENLLIDAEGQVQITDLGLAVAVHGDRFGGASSHSGTPEFAAPEQLLGETVDRRSDLYSLTMVAYFALTGEAPFRGPTVEAILARQTVGALPDLRVLRRDLPEAVVDVFEKGGARHPHERFESAVGYATALRQAMLHRADQAPSWIRRVFGP